MANLQPGQMLGPYQIINQIGQGGMATVYRAYHASMDRYVALKVLSHQFALSEEFLGRFQHEARLIAKLEHPHILPVHDFGESEGIPYLVMRYLEAGTLKEHLETSQLALPEIDRIFTQIAEALAYAHEDGIIHRDIKPSNVMLDKRGEVFLTDFGIAKMVEGSPKFTATGAITGTPSYMSPEQAQGLTIDQRSDIYSLGIVLYEMLTGRVPFEAETPMAVIIKQIQEPLPPLSSIKPDIHPAIEAVLLKALTKDPNVRFASVQEFLAAWKRAVGEATARETVISGAPRPRPQPQPAAAPTIAPPRALTPPAPAKKRIPAVWIGVAAVGMIILVGAGALLVWQILGGGAEPTTAPSILTIPSPEARGWTSWGPANTVNTIAFLGNQVFAGGPGGVTVWDSSDGSFQRITTLDGLPSNEVNAIYIEYEDSQWFGTAAGLAHFTEGAWTIYDTQDGLWSDFISAITEIDGQLWVGTQYAGEHGSGLMRFDGEAWHQIMDFPSMAPYDVEGQPGILSYNVTAILEGLQGEIWVATTLRLGRFDGENWVVYGLEQGLPHEGITSLHLDWDNTLWVGTDMGHIARLEGESFQLFKDLNEFGIYEVWSILQDNGGRFWFAGSGGLARYDPDQADWETYFSGQHVLSSATDDEDNLYFGLGWDGLARYDGDFETWVVPNLPFHRSSGRILSAPDGTLWFMDAWGDHVDTIDPRSEIWSTPWEPEVCCPIPMAFDAEGRVWAGGDTGLWILTANSPTNLTTDQGLPSNYITTISLAPDGTAWVGTDAGLASIKELKVAQVFNPAGATLAGDYVFSIWIASDGSVWASTDRGVTQITTAGEMINFYSDQDFDPPVEYILDIAEDQQQDIWVVTSNEGAFYFSEGRWQRSPSSTPDHPMPGFSVNTLAAGPDGSLWFGQDYDGAARLKDGQWTFFTVGDGLVHDSINDIYIDVTGAVWFATDSGISRYVP